MAHVEVRLRYRPTLRVGGHAYLRMIDLAMVNIQLDDVEKDANGETVKILRTGIEPVTLRCHVITITVSRSSN